MHGHRSRDVVPQPVGPHMLSGESGVVAKDASTGRFQIDAFWHCGAKMAAEETDDQFSDEETVRRRDEAIRRALNTPPTLQKEMIGRAGAPTRGRPKRRSRPVDKGKDQV
jgi:hypothetical protein